MKTRTIKLGKSRRNNLRKFAQGLGATKKMDILLTIDEKGRVCVADLLKYFKSKDITLTRRTLLNYLDDLVEESILARENGKYGSRGWYTINEVNEVNKDFFTFMYGNMSAKVNPYHRNYVKLSKEANLNSKQRKIWDLEGYE
tara:strand:+ start:480 stop:908 length:429 start_codon:yes stop_codon:yes gene_type:complete